MTRRKVGLWPIPLPGRLAHTEAVTGAGALTLVPPGRLGTLLRDTRRRLGSSYDDIAARSRFSPSELVAIEAGERRLTDAEMSDLLDAYGVQPADVLPDRGALVIDLREGELIAGGLARELGGTAPTPDEVLATYLSVVYTLRRAQPGTSMSLRTADVEVLGKVLQLATTEVTVRLDDLMREPSGAVSHRMRLLRKRLLIPAAGIVIGATAVGAVLFVQARVDDHATTAPPAAEAPAAPDAQVAEPQVVERNPDGSVGQQGTRAADPNALRPAGAVVIGDGIAASDLGPGDVGLAPAQVLERGTAGAPGVQTPRAGDAPDPGLTVDQNGTALIPPVTQTR